MVRQGSYENQSNDYQNNPGVFSFLDTAGTTSTITYNVKGYTSNSGYPLYVNRTQSRLRVILICLSTDLHLH